MQDSTKTEFSEFGTTTRTRRLELGMTQEQVAEQVGVKPNYIGYLERGLRKPSDEICCRIADVLGLERKDLFFLANPHVRDIINPPDEPSLTAWERFRRDRQLHTRQGVTDAEMRVLESIATLGEVREPRDYLFLLATIRQSLSRG
jgi:transcriptional regulator with XRE-family HTH domain